MFIDNLEKIRCRINAAAKRANRNGEAITLVAVTKYAPFDAVKEVLLSGLVLEVGENRVSDAAKKKQALGDLAGRVRWRLIGHLQTNKAGKAVSTFDAVDSVDSAKLAAALDAASVSSDRTLPVMIQVKLSERETQSGTTPAELPGLIETVRRSARLELQGLMGIAPNVEPVEAVRPSFRLLKELRDKHLPDGKLSMGMSRDFEIAIEEGADLVRIGSQIFTHPSMEATA